MGRIFRLALFSVLLTMTHSMIMRNNALMSKMVSRFQGNNKENTRGHKERESKSSRADVNDEEHNPSHVLTLMQNVLCKNFPSIPCDVIVNDKTLLSLIEKSIQQLKYKKVTMKTPTSPPNYQLTLFPVVNSEDLSNFLSVSNTGSFKKKTRSKAKNSQKKNYWSHEKKKKSKTAMFNGRKNLRKYYPHKIKYKDKGVKRDFNDNSDEKLSMSVETPREQSTSVKRKQFNLRGHPSDPPVWRIDYMKHGEPSFNMFGYQSDSLNGKITKTGPNVIVDDNVLQAARRDNVLHPDLYIKSNFPRKTVRDNSGAME